jgi:hypothetical protein
MSRDKERREMLLYMHKKVYTCCQSGGQTKVILHCREIEWTPIPLNFFSFSQTHIVHGLSCLSFHTWVKSFGLTFFTADQFDSQTNHLSNPSTNLHSPPLSVICG